MHFMIFSRIGRTARIGHDGESVTLLDPKRDSAAIPNLIAILKDAEKPIPDVLANWGSGGYSSYRGSGGSYGSGNTFGQSASDHREFNNHIREAGQGYAPSKFFSSPPSSPPPTLPPTQLHDGSNEGFLSESLRIPF